MSTPTIALVTATAARNVDEDLAPLQSALQDAGAEVRVVEWDADPGNWGRFDLALLRSTWDYPERLADFLEWAREVSARTTLLNPLPVIKWSADKHYLSHLARAGVPAVFTKFVEPGESAEPRIAELLARPDAMELVVKPAVGAGSRDAQRYGSEQRGYAVEHAHRLLADKRSVLLQPYLQQVDDYGETALIYFDGAFSHAIRKGPLLRRGEGPTQGLFAAEQITPRVPDATELQVGARALAALPFETPLYARVDLIRDHTGAPCVLELELIEPSLFFLHAAGAAERFVTNILRRLA